ncbi:MAG TPA: CARDB domain-containing protein [Polyangiaceae bacterium]|jgi:hypothetical protein|nr:CARDB domain-containing protein [Polyangiaceae bacterium]
MLGNHTFYVRLWRCAGVLAALSGCAAPASNTTAAAPAPVASSPGSVNTDNPADPASTGVDLAVTNISWSPPKPKVNDAVTFSATVKNKGTVATEEGIVIGVAFQINDMNVSWSDTNKTSLGPGQSRTLTANYGPSQTSTWLADVSGEHRLAAWVDDVNRLPDANRDNNRVEVPLPIQ